jgi:hypothetical protein
MTIDKFEVLRDEPMARLFEKVGDGVICSSCALQIQLLAMCGAAVVAYSSNNECDDAFFGFFCDNCARRDDDHSLVVAAVKAMVRDHGGELFELAS